MAGTQDQIAKIWADLLGVKTAAPNDNFFAIGGHSLLAVKLIAAVQEKLQLDAELGLGDLLEHPTLADFSAHIEMLMADEESGAI